ncbi:MAG: ThiF family adenylyltransferase [Candidatus Babeliaceae bacterium]|nr:ThiF family adenylyltransferase [Candidatus Babeliaceae bacterium]
MNHDRIKETVDVERMRRSHVTIVGGAFQLACDLARCGLGAITLVDFDRIDKTNPARQDFDIKDINRLKIEATADTIKRINPQTNITCLPRDFCSITNKELEEYFGQTDLFILATDFFPAQARGNVVSIQMNKPALFIGMYAGGRAGEIIYFIPNGPTKACYRCICSSRYKAFQKQTDISVNSGGTIADLHLIDSIAAQAGLGILTRGADNRMGRLIEQLDGRNLIQVKIDPEYRLGDKDIFAKHLGNSPANFSFTSIAIEGSYEPDCPDCNGHRVS